MATKVRVLTVVTSHADLGKTGKKTGWYLPEVAHPYDVFTKAGFEVDFMSPKGGDAPMVTSISIMFMKNCHKDLTIGPKDYIT